MAPQYTLELKILTLTLEETREGGIFECFSLSVYLGCKVIFQMVMGCVSRDIAEEILEKCVLMV